jgi:hypothetical protein
MQQQAGGGARYNAMCVLWVVRGCSTGSQEHRWLYSRGDHPKIAYQACVPGERGMHEQHFEHIPVQAYGKKLSWAAKNFANWSAHHPLRRAQRPSTKKIEVL